MSFVTFPVIACRTLVVLFAGLAPLVLAAGSSGAADYRSMTQLPPPKTMGVVPSGAELVGRLLSERSNGSDPDVPLPQRGLEEQPAFVPLTGPQIYGRREEGSLVLGLKIPIPADRGAFQQNAR